MDLEAPARREGVIGPEERVIVELEPEEVEAAEIVGRAHGGPHRRVANKHRERKCNQPPRPHGADHNRFGSKYSQAIT
jgi:hypothetical protein